MNLLIFYLIICLSGWAIGSMQRQALTHHASTLLFVTLIMRLAVIVLGVCALTLLHLSFLHFILSIVVFWSISWLAYTATAGNS